MALCSRRTLCITAALLACVLYPVATAVAATPDTAAEKARGIPAAPAVAGAAHLRPTFERVPGGAMLRNALSQARVPEDLSDGVRLGAVVLRPSGALQAAGPASFVGRDFAVYPASSELDTIIGATVNGLRIYARIGAEGPDPDLSWSVGGDTAVSLREGEDGAVSVYSGGGGVVARASVEARDSAGAELPVELRAAEDDSLTIALGAAPAKYPVFISLGVSQSTTSTGEGWHLHAFGHQLEGSQLEIRRGTRVSGTCRFLDLAVEASPGEPQERRAVAIDWENCRSVEEVGEPSPGEVQRFFGASNASSDSDPELRSTASRARLRTSSSPAKSRRRSKSKSRFMARAAADPRWYYRYKAIWEDPAGLDTSWIAPKVNWAYYGGCVHNPVYYGVDWGMVTATGWQLVFRSPYSDATCSRAVRSEYAKFEGGQYFPLCFGSKVQAYYWPASAYGFASGTGAGSIDTWLTGASCKSLLHYDSIVSQGPG